MKLAIASFVLASLSGCVTNEAEREVPGCSRIDCVALGEAQEVGLAESDLVVKPLEILEDSRCPIEAECIWAGRVRIRAELTMGHETVISEMTTERPLRIHGGMLSIGEVAPEASGQWMPLTPSDYRFGFVFASDIMQPGPTGS